MRQTPFGVWNLSSRPRNNRRLGGSNEADAFRRLECGHYLPLLILTCHAPMRQTPFGVWNLLNIVADRLRFYAPMRQTPFGVWNLSTPV